ncbi:ligase [Sulfolobales archaeon HS-7]|nr:ligase [Sulfolobales archaeon HS-7]
MSWRYVRLPPQDPYHMITSFLAVGDHVSKGTKNTMLVFNSLETFVNVGFHQEVWLEVDLDYVRKNGIPVVRRDVGGGTVVITPGEVDYFLVMKSEDAPTNQSELYKKFLSPVASFLNSYGVKAEIREQDIVVGGRKISGNGAMTRGKSVILAGNVLVDVDVNVIAKCLRVPSAKFRDKLAKEMSEWITSMKRETGKTPSVEEVAKGLKKAFEEAGFSFSEEELTEDEVRDWNRLAEEKMRESWIYYKDLRHPELRSERCVKINFSVTLCHVDYKARKLIRITAKFSKEKVEEVSISGDFFVLTPRDFVERLEDRIRGIRVGDIEQVIRDTFNEFRPTIFGFDENDLINAFNEMLIKPEVQEIIS